jgi:hypothetical protein
MHSIEHIKDDSVRVLVGAFWRVINSVIDLVMEAQIHFVSIVLTAY